MPTYEYKCDACGQAFEKFQSIKADPITVCPHCGEEKVRRLISAGGGLIFKGSGFYITDYREKGYSDQAKAESGKSDAKSDGKAESKTDGKTDKPATGGEPAKSSEATSTESKPAATATPTPSPTPTPAKSES